MAAPMDSELQKFILKEKSNLKPLTTCNDDLLDRMVAFEIFKPIDKDEIKCKSTPDSKASEFYDILSRKPNGAYEKTINVLKACGQDTAAGILARGLSLSANAACNTGSQNKITPLSDEEIYTVARILAEDSLATQKKYLIHGKLNLPITELNELKQKELRDNFYDSYSFFTDSLSAYRATYGSKATMAALKVVFEQLGLQAIVEKM